MRDDELRSRLTTAVDQRLSGLEGDPFLARRIIRAEEGEKPIVKKKLSVSLVLAMAAMLLTLSVGVALVTSNIAEHLYGEQENAPQELLQKIHTPQETTASALGEMTLDEWLWDGRALHTAFTMRNPTQDTLLYTLEGIWVNGQQVSYNRISTEGAGDSGYLLGGAVDGVQLPQSVSLYNEGAEVYLFDENGKFAGMGDLPQGEVTLKIAMAAWKPIRPVELVDYARCEGVNVTETKDHLVTDEEGYCQLWLFRPEEYAVNYNASQLGCEAMADAYRELGWAEVADIIELETVISLNRADIVRAVPTETVYRMGEVQAEITGFDMSHAGGQVEGWLRGEDSAVKALMGVHGLCLADPVGDRILSSGTYWDDQQGQDGAVHFVLSLAPVTGELPVRVLLAPVVDMDNRLNKDYPDYDPTLEKPENAVDWFLLDLDRAADIQLQKAE